MMGRADEARQAGELALQLDPTQAAAWLAMSDVESAAGNADRAAAHKLRAAQVAPFHPGYALLIEL
jgi:tetratricopeptide (TPR) repeat protein